MHFGKMYFYFISLVTIMFRSTHDHYRGVLNNINKT